MTQRLRRSKLWVFAGIAALLLTVANAAYAQPGPDLGPNPAPEAAPAEKPPSQPRAGIQRITPVLPPEIKAFVGSEDGASRVDWDTVWFDGRRLLRVAALMEDRDDAIERQLEAFVTQDFDPTTLTVTPEKIGTLTVLMATARLDGPGDGAETIASELLTVTVADAQWLSYDLLGFDRASQQEVVDTLARTWATRIERSLIRFKAERQGRFLLQQLQIACGILVGLLVLSMSLLRPKRRLEHRQNRLEEERTAIAQKISDMPEDDASARLTLAQQDQRAQQQQSISLLKRRVVQLGELALWISGGFVVVGLIPYTRWLQVLLLEASRIPGKLLIIVLVTYLLIRIDDILIDRLFAFLQRQTPRFLIHDSQRRMLRFSTFSTVAKSITNTIFAAAGGLAALWVVGVDIGPLVAGAGIFGLAVSFAAQSLIRDIINGFLILFEDQYGVGDVVILGDVAGFVENMGLRITQLRNEEGRLITVPNGAITVVQNLTKEWSRVDLTIDVAYAANIDQALAVITKVAHDLQHDPGWKSIILEPAAVLGVDQLTHAGATVRLWIKTLPLKQWDVAREYRRRLKIAFDKAGIDIGTPHQAIYFDGPLAGAVQPGLANVKPADTPN
ncbi:MAG: mechanosensitive ion channel family protein [Elainellaceae cyanobacterium]